MSKTTKRPNIIGQSHLKAGEAIASHLGRHTSSQPNLWDAACGIHGIPRSSSYRKPGPGTSEPPKPVIDAVRGMLLDRVRASCGSQPELWRACDLVGAAEALAAPAAPKPLPSDEAKAITRVLGELLDALSSFAKNFAAADDENERAVARRFLHRAVGVTESPAERFRHRAA